MENAGLRAEFLPDPGGKMVSLINKENGYEYLVQRENPLYRDQPFDGIYVNGECSGYDDMFPTIDACEYQNEPWKGVKMADHGEVWSLPWEYHIDDGSLHFSVSGKRFPYKLEKNICFLNDHTLRLDYTVTNESSFDYEFLWAGHFMINIEEGAKVEVPDDCRQVVTIFTNGKGKFGDLKTWPFFEDKEGNMYRADICRPKNVNANEKYYFKNRLKEGWCRLSYPHAHKKIEIAFPADTVPYLGILMNEGGWDGLYNIFIEPCTVSYDRPDVAKKHGQICYVKAQGTCCWHIEISI